MNLEPFLSRNFIIGISLMLGGVLFYAVMTDIFYYGGGWPFVQIVFAIIYFTGARFVFKSSIPYWLKLVLGFWWVAVIAIIILLAIFSS